MTQFTLGLDASTKTVGYACTDQATKTILDCGFVDISKLEKNKDKTFHFIKAMEEKPWLKNVTAINVEAALSGFGGGKTSQQVIIMLSRFSAVFCYIIEEHYKIEPCLANATTMRKQLFGKARIKGVKPKDYVRNEIEKRFDLSPWVVLNRNKEPDVRMDDVRDAVVAGFYSAPPVK